MKTMNAIRNAVRQDVPAIVTLLADDPLGKHREMAGGSDLAEYFAAFDAIDIDANNELLVAVNSDRKVGTLQITYTPGLSGEAHGGQHSKVYASPRSFAAGELANPS
jgi:hypothetical protein